jgi:phage baseplate assembly protein gpV
MTLLRFRFGFALVFSVALVGCGNGSVHSDADAMKAYLGLDASIDKAIGLGFDGFNSPSTGANIMPQTASGTLTGMLTVTGIVDQGSSPNKNMTLNCDYKMYSDIGKVTYDATAGALPVLAMSLKGIPTGTLSGSLNGALTMTGDLKNSVTLALTFTGTLQAGANNTVIRAPGTTHITGTATSDYGTYTVDVTR